MQYFVDHQYGEVYADRTRYGGFAWNEAKGSSGCLKSVKIAGQPIPQVQGSDNLNASSSNAWYYNQSINISFLKVFDNSPNITITAEYF